MEYLRTLGYSVTVFALVGALGYAYLAGSQHATLKAELKAEREYALAVNAAKEQAEENLRMVNVANQLNAIKSEQDAAHIEELERNASATPANLNHCLDLDAARRVRVIR